MIEDDTFSDEPDERAQAREKTGQQWQVIIGVGVTLLTLLFGFVFVLGVVINEMGTAGEYIPLLGFIPFVTVVAVALYLAIARDQRWFGKGVLIGLGVALLLFGLCVAVLTTM